MASAVSVGKRPPERAKPIRQPGNRRDNAVGNFPTLTIMSVASLSTSASRAPPRAATADDADVSSYC
jgi:hypothetical protein